MIAFKMLEKIEWYKFCHHQKILALVFIQAGCFRPWAWPAAGVRILGWWGNMLRSFLWLDEGLRVACPDGPSAWELPAASHWQPRDGDQHPFPSPPSQNRMPCLNLSIDVVLCSLMKAYCIFKVENPGNKNVWRTLLDFFFLVRPVASHHFPEITGYVKPILKEVFSVHRLDAFCL